MNLTKKIVLVAFIFSKIIFYTSRNLERPFFHLFLNTVTFITIKIYVAVSENFINHPQKNATFCRDRLFARRHRNASETSHAHACWTMPGIPGDRLCSVFCEQIGERGIGTQTRRQGRLEKGRGVVASTAVERRRKKRRRRKTRKRSSSREAESIVTFFLCLSPCKSPPSPSRFFPVPFLFPPTPNFIPVHHAIPSTSPKPSQTHRLVLRCAPLLSVLHIAYHGLAFCPLYYVFGHYK